MVPYSNHSKCLSVLNKNWKQITATVLVVMKFCRNLILPKRPEKMTFQRRCLLNRGLKGIPSSSQWPLPEVQAVQIHHRPWNWWGCHLKLQQLYHKGLEIKLTTNYFMGQNNVFSDNLLPWMKRLTVWGWAGRRRLGQSRAGQVGIDWWPSIC